MRILLVLAAAACVYARTADQQQSFMPGPMNLSTGEVPNEHRLKRSIGDELLYETNDRGERVMVRSINSDQSANLRFTNLTNRPVDIWWRDYQGRRVHYKQVAANETYDVNSYITHPWEFTDAQTKESYEVNFKPVFRAPDAIAGRSDRTNYNITPIY